MPGRGCLFSTVVMVNLKPRLSPRPQTGTAGHLALSKPQPQLPRLMLAFAPVKKARIDYIAEKATELGVGIIQPVVTAYTNVARVNTGRLAANAIEAAEQTGRLTIPMIREPLSLEAFLAELDPHFDLIFCDEGLAPDGEGAMIERVSSLTGRQLS